MSYQSSRAVSQSIPGEFIVVASLAAAFSMFMAGYVATRSSLGSSTGSTPVSEENVQLNVVAHEGTLWESVGQN